MSGANYDEFVRECADRYRDAFGGALLAALKIGSLAHGGFSPAYSDLDLALIFERPVDPAALTAVRESLRSPLAGRLSLFWTTRGFEGGRFPMLDLIDLKEHGVPVLGSFERASVPDFPLAAVRAYLEDHPRDFWRAATRRFSAARSVAVDDFKELLRCVLYPARLKFTWARGRLTSNDAAVEFLRAEPIPGVDPRALERALEFRRTGGRDEAFLGEVRDGLTARFEATWTHLLERYP